MSDSGPGIGETRTNDLGSTGAMIEALWLQFGPLVEARIAAVDAFVAAASGPLGEGPTSDPSLDDRRAHAREAAHNLAGSLGSYGRPDGSVVAASIDAELDQPVVDLALLARLVSELRASIARRST